MASMKGLGLWLVAAGVSIPAVASDCDLPRCNGGYYGAQCEKLTKSCVEIRNVYQGNQWPVRTGTYYVDFDGEESAHQPQQVFCDMEKDGGGWMLVLTAGANFGGSVVRVENSMDPALDVEGTERVEGSEIYTAKVYPDARVHAIASVPLTEKIDMMLLRRPDYEEGFTDEAFKFHVNGFEVGNFFLQVGEHGNFCPSVVVPWSDISCHEVDSKDNRGFGLVLENARQLNRTDAYVGCDGGASGTAAFGDNAEDDLSMYASGIRSDGSGSCAADTSRSVTMLFIRNIVN